MLLNGYVGGVGWKSDIGGFDPGVLRNAGMCFGLERSGECTGPVISRQKMPKERAGG